MSNCKSVDLDGLEVQLFRGKDGKLVVEIQSGALEDRDTHVDNGCPNIRIWINEQKIEISQDGTLIVDDVDLRV